MCRTLSCLTLLAVFLFQASHAQTPRQPDLSDLKKQHEMLRDFKRMQHERAALQGSRRDEKPAVGEDYDVFYYGLNLTVDHVEETIGGNVVMGAVSLSDSLDTAMLDFFNDLTVDSVKWGGQTFTFTHVNEVLSIDLAQTIGSGEPFFVNTYYHGTPVSYDWGSFGFDQHSTGPVIWTLSEPTYARSWWPCKDIPSDKADSVDIWLTVADDLVATSEGKLREVVDNGDGTKTYKWHEAYPLTTYLVSLAISNYASFSDWYHAANGDSMEVRFWVYPQDSAAAEIDFSVTVSMIEAYSDVFGIEYPFLSEKYGMSEFPWGGGMEHQTNTSYGEWLIQGNHHFDFIVGHELSHMWWGDMVTCADFINIWLNEGFATYSEALWAEHLGGATGLRDYMLEIDVSPGDEFPGSIYDPDDTFNSTVYEKGAWALHMLRHVVGDSTFFEILKEYGTHPSYAYASATTQDFQDVCEDVSGMDLDWFFQEWIYGEKRPIYQYWWVKEEGQPDWNVQLHINQTQTSVPAFKMPIDIELGFAAGETTFVVWDSLPSQDFYFTVGEEPVSIAFDPWAWVLKRATQIPPQGIGDEGPDGSPIPMVYSLAQNHPNPFNPRTTISYTVGAADGGLDEPVPVRLAVYDLRGRLVARLFDGTQKPGAYQVVWEGRGSDGSSVSSGIYFYVLDAGQFRSTKKMVLLK